MLDARRILVYGVTGSGKSTLAAQISERTGIPWHCVDDFTWLPGWQPTPDDEQRRAAAAICAGEGWVLDSAYGCWSDIAVARAELVVALDYPRWISLGRLLRRTVVRVVGRTPVCNGNTESWRSVFSRESILLWHFQSFAGKRRQIRAWVDGDLDAQVLRLTTPKATQAWLESLGEPSTRR